jgi:hypothetical protein
MRQKEKAMADENKVSSISKAHTLEEMLGFWETHSIADFDEETHEVDLEFAPIARLNLVRIEPELMQELWAIARDRPISAQTLINVWLRQQVDAARMRVAA